MDSRLHWEKVYSAGSPGERSWFRPHLNTSLKMIEESGVSHGTPILDVGGGESTLVDDLLARGYERVTVLDLSRAAIGHTRARLGPMSERGTWLSGDVLEVALPPAFFGLWHDRAVFHFLNEEAQRVAYVDQIRSALCPGGHVIMGTFGPQGPERCSGLKTMRYTPEALQREFGRDFQPVETAEEWHRTPSGNMQQFVYCHWILPKPVLPE